MACRGYRLPGGGQMIVCGPHRPRPPCEATDCGPRPAAHVALCDFPVVRNGRPATCDLKLCERHRWPMPGHADSDLCPAHRRLYEAEQGRLDVASLAELREYLAAVMARSSQASEARSAAYWAFTRRAKAPPVSPALIRHEQYWSDAVREAKARLADAEARGEEIPGGCSCVGLSLESTSRSS
jgi:hypothetical protein